MSGRGLDKNNPPTTRRRPTRVALTWRDVPPGLVHAFVCLCTEMGALVSLGTTFDNAALAILVKQGDERPRRYVNHLDEVEPYMLDILDMLGYTLDEVKV